MDRLVGGAGTLGSQKPVKTIGSYWPYATTLFDYVYRAMPFPAPQSLSSDEVYSVVAWLLYQNGNQVEAENGGGTFTVSNMGMYGTDEFAANIGLFGGVDFTSHFVEARTVGDRPRHGHGTPTAGQRPSASIASTAGIPRDLVRNLSIPRSWATPPHRATPRSMISEMSSGGVFSSTRREAETISASGSSRASTISSVVRVAGRGRPFTWWQPTSESRTITACRTGWWA